MNLHVWIDVVDPSRASIWEDQTASETIAPTSEYQTGSIHSVGTCIGRRCTLLHFFRFRMQRSFLQTRTYNEFAISHEQIRIRLQFTTLNPKLENGIIHADPRLQGAAGVTPASSGLMAHDSPGSPSCDLRLGHPRAWAFFRSRFLSQRTSNLDSWTRVRTNYKPYTPTPSLNPEAQTSPDSILRPLEKVIGPLRLSSAGRQVASS